MSAGGVGDGRTLPVGDLLLAGLLRGTVVGALSGPILVSLYAFAATAGSWVPSIQQDTADSSGSMLVSALSNAMFALFFGIVPAALVGLFAGAVVGVAAAAGAIGAVLATDRWSPSTAGPRAVSPRFGAASALGGAAGGGAMAALVLSQLGIYDPTMWVLALSWVTPVSAWLAGRALRAARTRVAVAARTHPNTPAAGTRSVARLGRTITGLGCVPLCVAVVMAAIAAIRVGWGRNRGFCAGGGSTDGDGAVASGRYNFSSGYFPPQARCVYENGTVVELMSVQYLVVVVVLSLLAAGMLCVGLLLPLRSRLITHHAPNRSPLTTGNEADSAPDSVAEVTRRLACIAALALSLTLATSHLIGLVMPPPPFDATADNTRGTTAAPLSPPQSDPVEPAPDTPAPDPQPVPTISTAFTLAELTAEMQDLVDSSIQTAGPIDDPSIPAGTTFPVTANSCIFANETGLQLSLEVGFNTVDDAAGLERVRTLWAAEGYELYSSSTNARGDTLDPTTRVDALGNNILPGQSLGLRIYDDYLILTVYSLCVATR